MSSLVNFPIAIIGVACRLPGGIRSLDNLWSVISQKKDAVTRIPPERWDTSLYLHPRRNMQGRAVTDCAGVIDGIYDFDQSFFGISRTEAEAMDPQQRILLELTWEALEDAGIIPSTLSGSDTAVFVGAASTDAGSIHADDICSTTPYSMTGTNLSIISNRISYIYNFHGPSMTIDTACSSAMHALHQACQTLASGGAGMAVAGGVNALLSPYPFVGFSQGHILSATGRCKVFDASGDGYVRAEGGGIVLLQPLDEALAQGRHIHGIIRCIGINSDGRTQGIALPSEEAQADLLREIYATANISPDRLAYVEAHGTGTAVGDPIETSALGQVLGQKRRDPLWVGSVKCNLGHLETASAMAGLMKALAVLKKRRIPPQIHLSKINPAIDTEKLNLRFPLKVEDLPEVDGQPCIGVSSFGFGGANGHLVIEAAAPVQTKKTVQTEVPPLFLSAKSEESLRMLADSYARRTEAAPGDYYDLAYGAFYKKELLPLRLAVEGSDPAAVAAALKQFAAGDEKSAGGAVTGEATPPSPQTVKTAFVFSGNGGQWAGMGKTMMENAAFAARAKEVADLMLPLSGVNLLDLLNNATAEDIAHTDIAQQLLFLIQVGLCAALDEKGIRADAAFGHSVGEVAAAWYTGVMSLREAVKIIYYRSMHQESTAGAGRMAAVSISAEEARELIARYSGVELAGINSSDAATLSGDAASLEKIGAELKSRRVFFKMLPLNYAFHSARMDTIREALLEDLKDLDTGKPKLHFISSVTGKEHLSGCPAAYWWDNVRKPVNFREAEQTAITMGVRHFLEIGPHSILLRYLRSGLDKADCADGNAVEGWVGGTLTRNSGTEQFSAAWKSAWTHGWPADLSKHFPTAGNDISLPSYAWNNIECLVSPTPECQGFVRNAADHPLLGRRLHGQNVWENTVDLENFPWLRDHKIGDNAYYPAAAFLEMVTAAAWKVSQESAPAAVCNTAILRPVILRENQPVVLRTTVDAADGEIRVQARPFMQDEPWTLHVKSRIIETGAASRTISLMDTPEKFGEAVTSQEIYDVTVRVNMGFGPVFRRLDCCWKQGEEVLSRFKQETDTPAWAGGMLIPPPLLDGGMQSIYAVISDAEKERPFPRLPYWFDKCILLKPGVPAYAMARKLRSSRFTTVCNVSLFSDNGQELMRLEGCRVRIVEQLAAPRPQEYATFAVPLPHPESPAPRNLPDVQVLAEKLTSHVADLTADAGWRRYCDETLPLREMAALALIHELENREADLTQAELAVHLRQYAAAKQHVIDTGLPPFADIWRTLISEDPRSSAVNFLLANSRRTLLEQEEQLPADNPVWAEYRRQEYKSDNRLCGYALNEMCRNIPGTVSLLEISATPASLGRLMSPELRTQRRILTAPGESEMQILRQAVLSADRSAGDAPLETSAWDFTKAECPHKAHAAVAFHCLHQADDIPAVLRRCHDALHNNGLFIMAEREPNIIDDLLFGQDRNWWVSASDNSGSVSRLMTADEWSRALKDTGFSDVTVIRPDAAVPDFIILARAEATASPAQKPANPEALWLLCSDSNTPSTVRELLNTLEQQVSSRGDEVIRLTAGDKLSLEGAAWQCRPDSAADWQAVWQNLAARGLPLNAVDAVYLGGDGLSLTAAENQCAVLTELARGWYAAGRPAVTLRVLTEQAQSCPDSLDSGLRPAQAAVIGAARVLMNEMPGLETACIDLHSCSQDAADRALIDAALTELIHPSKEREIILSGDRRYVLRSENTVYLSHNKTGSTCRLECTAPGHLETLRWEPADLAEPGPDQVRVAVRAVGLNFRDVMWAMNMLPEEALENGFSGPGLGIECAGIADAVGSRVTDIVPGQRVLCFGSQCFAGHVVTSARAVTQIPEEWSFADAATVPVAFYTAWYALSHLAHMQPGERLLIHGAAGGVGLAAVQIATTLGLEVFATAGSKDKQHMLRLLGVEHIYNSRSYSFHDEILADTDGAGVDAVLNSLAGEGIDQSLRLLRPFGRFLELGKRDFYADNSMRLRPFRNNISYFGIDVDQLMKERPELARQVFTEIMEHFRNGEWNPLPYSLYEAGEAELAYRTMQQSRHVGKIVVEPPAVTAGAASEPHSALPVSSSGSYIVTGGLGGFGLATARHLANRGAGALVLLSRKGKTAANAAVLEELETLNLPDGVKRPVIALAQDVTDYSGLSEQLDAALKDLPPLKGIVHAAAVLDDGMLTDMTPERLKKVMRPKLGGAFNLHRYSLDKKLDFFVMFSSATTLLGNPGQTNYVAANMGLETLAALRRGMGLPGIAVGWGAIGDTGMLTRDSRAMDSLSRVTGITPLRAAQALEALEDLKDTCSPAPALLIADWKRLSRMPLGRMPRFAALRVDADDSEDVSLSDIVKNLPQDKAMMRITEIITSIIARIMGVPPASVKTGTPLSGMGMDSLMAVEMMVAIEDRLEGKSIVGGITASSSIRDVATRIYALLSNGDEVNDVRRALETKHGITITDSLANKIRKEVGI